MERRNSYPPELLESKIIQPSQGLENILKSLSGNRDKGKYGREKTCFFIKELVIHRSSEKSFEIVWEGLHF